jgi:hypothetical protein
VQLHHLQAAHYPYLLKLRFVKCQLWYIGVWLKSVVIFFFLLHAPLLGVILHALMWYLQFQSLGQLH